MSELLHNPSKIRELEHLWALLTQLPRACLRDTTHLIFSRARGHPVGYGQAVEDYHFRRSLKS